MSDVFDGEWNRAFEEGRKAGRQEGMQESFDEQMQYPHMVQLMLDIRNKAIRDCITELEADDFYSEDPSWSGTQWNNAVFECKEALRALLKEKP